MGASACGRQPWRHGAFPASRRMVRHHCGGCAMLGRGDDAQGRDGTHAVDSRAGGRVCRAPVGDCGESVAGPCSRRLFYLLHMHLQPHRERADSGAHGAGAGCTPGGSAAPSRRLRHRDRPRDDALSPRTCAWRGTVHGRAAQARRI